MTDFIGVQKWYAEKCNKTVDELDDYDNHICKVSYDYATELVENLSISGVSNCAPKLTQCMADRGGDCEHELCPQVLENEPETTGRGCPLPFIDYRQ